MKMCVKKVFCPNCQKLMACREQKVDGQSQVLCFKCGRQLRLWTGTSWRLVRESV